VDLRVQLSERLLLLLNLAAYGHLLPDARSMSGGYWMRSIRRSRQAS
jgi:hypothetical protein